MTKILLLINPHARSGQETKDQVAISLKEMGYEIIEPDQHKQPYDPNELILKYKELVSFVVIGGGDGSVNAALPALMETQIPLVVIPLGTANNLARSFSIPNDYQSAIQLIKHGEEKTIDVGMVNGIPFLNVAGLGLSTEVNRHVSKQLKKYLGVGAFILTAVKMAIQMNPFRAEIVVDGGKPIFTKSWQISVCNGKYYGSGLAIKEDASLNDVKLHLLSTEVKKWWHSITMISSFMTGKFKKDDDVTLVSGREIVVQTRRRFSIDVDGDLKTITPAKFHVIPRALRIMTPVASAG